MATATKARKPRQSKKTAPKVTVTIATFDSSYSRPVYRAVREAQPVNEFTPLTHAHYRPGGGTPLLDATAQFIAHLEGLQRKGTVVIGALADESGSMGGNEKSVIDGINEFVGGMADVEVDPDAEGKVLAVILTDGEENASHEVTGEQVKAMIEEREAKGWTFIYLGANQDAWAVGAKLATTRSANFVSSSVGTRSALDWAGEQSRSYLQNVTAYSTLASASPNATVAEEGGETE